MTDPASIGTALVGLGVIVTTAYSGWQGVQAKREAKAARTTAADAHHEAQRAADNSHPISNGWGTALRADMAAQRLDMAELRSLVDRMDRRQTTADERSAVMEREVREANQHARTAAEQAAAVATGLSAHLADHTRSDLATT